MKTAYSPSHPWYYYQGGKILTPKEILRNVQRGDLKGYAHDRLEQANNFPEPQRTKRLNELRKAFYADLRRDLSIYRECALEHHDETPIAQPVFM